MPRANAPWILGLSASHNGGACLLHGSELVVAIQEERLSAVKRDRTYGARPSLATNYCLQHAGIGPGDLSMIVLSVQGSGDWEQQDLALNPQLRTSFHKVPWLRISHHFGHAVSSYVLSGFTDAAVLVVDGMGSPCEDLSEPERAAVVGPNHGWEIISVYEAHGHVLRPVHKQLVPEARWLDQSGSGMPSFGSIGGMYSAVAQQIFGNPMDAGKVMGLAPFGNASFEPHEFLSICEGVATFRDTVPKAFPHCDRWPLRRAEYADLAASVQAALEDGMLALVRDVRSQSRSDNLCYSGGVALNCVVNERLHRESGFQDFFIAPFSEDSGPALGAAFYGLWQLLGAHPQSRLHVEGFGHRYTSAQVSDAIASVPGVVATSSPDTTDSIVTLLCDGKIGGWFEGGSELGPRALGRRSIVADPRRPAIKQKLNGDIKRRESFRPFAPSILAEHVSAWFEVDQDQSDSPFMLRTFQFREGFADKVPAVAHIDDTARIQSVSQQYQPRYYKLIRRFYGCTGIPMLLNTSMNGAGQPIIETPRDALWAMHELGLDFMVLEGVLVEPVPDRRLLLNLVPVIAANNFTVERWLGSGETSSDAAHSPQFTFRVATPWGTREHALTDAAVGVLNLIDGHATAHQIHAEMRRQHGHMDSADFVAMLTRLRRIGVIDLQATTDPHGGTPATGT